MDIKVKLSLNEDDAGAKKRVADAVHRKTAAYETMGQAWERIFDMKNAPKDVERLEEVRQALIKGTIGREPEALKKRFSKAEALRLYTALASSRREEKLAEMVAGTPANYHLITTQDELNKVVHDLYSEELIAIDTETTGVDVYTDKIVGISLTLPNADYHVYIPIGHTTGEEQVPAQIVFDALQPRIESGVLQKVLHNAKFDMHMFLRHGIKLRGLVWDTMVAMHLLNENENSFKLKDLATRYLKAPSDTFGTLFGKTPFYQVDLKTALVYAAKDTHLTYKLYKFQKKFLPSMPDMYKYYLEVENRIISVSLEMERTGFVLDLNKAAELKAQLTGELSALEDSMKQVLGDINFNSPKQLCEVLFDQLHLQRHLPPNWKKSTDVKTLKILARYNEGCKLLLEYREKTKLLGTYVEALPKQIKPDGRVHGNFHQTGTVTGRFSSRDPNLQNQPYYARKLFVAPEGMVILGGDFSQQEPRMLTHFTGEEALVQAYRAGKDLYSTLASQVFNKTLEECCDGSKWRKMMKVGVLAVMYGTQPKKLSEQLGITVAEAEKFIEDFYATYPKVKAWIDGNKAYLRKNGYVWMLGNRRKRRLTEIRSRDKWLRFKAERQATNARIQGSAAIQTKMTMIALSDWCEKKRKEGRNFMLLAQVHDEVLLYAPKDITREEVDEFYHIMIDTVKLSVPNKCDVELSERWGEGFTVDDWFNRAA